MGNKKIGCFIQIQCLTILTGFQELEKLIITFTWKTTCQLFRKKNWQGPPKNQFSAHLSLSEVKIDKYAFLPIFSDKNQLFLLFRRKVCNNKLKNVPINDRKQGSASGTGSPGSRSPAPENLGLILKFGSGTGTQIRNFRNLGPGLKFEKSGIETGSETQNQKIWDLGPGPGLKIEKSGIGDWDRDSDSRDEGFRDSTLGDCPGD